MKRLRAKKPILYMGRLYQAGDALPAHDVKMTDAWVAAGTAYWDGLKPDQAAQEAEETTEATQEAEETTEATQEAEETTEATQEAEADTEAAQEAETATAAIQGNLDAKQLDSMNKEQLVKLATDMKINLPKAATKKLIIDLLVAQPITADPDNVDEGAQ